MLSNRACYFGEHRWKGNSPELPYIKLLTVKAKYMSNKYLHHKYCLQRKSNKGLVRFPKAGLINNDD